MDRKNGQKLLALIFVASFIIPAAWAAYTATFSDDVWTVPELRTDALFIGADPIDNYIISIATGLVSGGGNFSAQYLGFDYVVYTNATDGDIYARSNDPLYPDETGTDFVTVVEAAYTNRAAVGCNIKYFGNYNITSTLDFPTTDNKKFSLTGNGMYNDALTADPTLGANTMLLCNRISWETPQKYTTIGLYDMNIDPANVADAVGEFPFTLIDIDRVYTTPHLSGSAKIVFSGGGAGGPSMPAHIGILTVNYVTGAENQRTLDLWYDTCEIDQLTMAVNLNSATQDLLDLDGEYYHIGQLSLFFGGAQMDAVINCNDIYLVVDQIQAIAGSGIINGIIYAPIDGLTDSVINIGQLTLGDPGYTAFKDAGSQSVSHVGGEMFEQSGTQATTINIATTAVTHNLHYTPTAGDIMLTPATGLYNCTSYAITAYSSTTFTITTYDNAGAAKGSSSAITFAWRAKK